MLALLALIRMGGLAFQWVAGGEVASVLARVHTGAGEVASGVGVMVRDARILWRVFLEPIAGYLVVWISSMCVFCALLCEALKSMLWEGSIRK